MGISLNSLNSGLSDTYSTLLSSLSSSSSSSSSGTDTSSLLSDYAAIKNGSYAKMMKAYYAKTSSSDDSASSSSSSTEKDSVTAASASSAYKSAENLTTFDFSEDNIDDAYTAVSDFIKDYNSMIKNASSSSNSSVQKQAQYMYDTMYSNYKLFANIGITLNSDRTLSISETSFKNGDVGTMKTLFSGSGSFADKVSARASQIYRYASDGQSVTAKSYTSSGTYSTTTTTESTIDSTT